MNASFEEKVVWLTLISLLVVFGLYFFVAAGMISAGIIALPAFVPLFVLVVVLLVVVMSIGAIVVAITSRPEGRDERDRLIEWRAESNASWLLAFGVLTGIVCLIIYVDNVWVAHLLLQSLILSEIVKLISQLIYYRRGV